LERVRANTVAAIRDDALAVVALLDQLQLDRVLGPVAAASDALRTATSGVLESLNELRALLALIRSRIDSFDTASLAARLPELLDAVEAFAREHLVAPVDAQILRLQEWVRSLLAELHLRAYRRDVTEFILGIAQAIRAADLDRYAETARAALREVQAALDPARLTAEVQQALAAAKAIIDKALNRVFASLDTIKAEIDAVAGEAETILNRAAQALASFRLAVEAATAAMDGLNVEAATQQTVDSLRRLRETAEALLSVAPLPESMRPTVEQLVEELRSLDFDVVFAPLRAAVAEFDIPDEVAGTIRASLGAVADILDNLIPRELIASLEAEIAAALETLRGFDPASLLSGVTGYLDEAADFIEGLNPEPLVGEIRGPFQVALDTLDAVHPRKLLTPVIEAYDSVMEKIKLPSPIKAAGAVAEAINSTGEGLATSLLQPLTQLAPAGTAEAPARTTPAAGPAGAATNTSAAPPGTAPNSGAAVPPPAFMSEVASFRPGDIVRVLAFLPNRLREILAGMEAGPAGETLRLIDSFTGGLARDLRALQAQLWQIEDGLGAWMDTELRPLGQAQLRAQLAMRANFSAGGISLEARMLAVAQAGPAAMRLALGPSTQMARQRARSVVMVGSRYGDALERAAQALERCALTGLAGDLDGFLAALDPEPLAAEIDALMAAVINKTPALMEQFGEALRESIRRLKALFDEVNPINQAEKFTRVLDVVREELDLLDPRRLADELAEVHAAIREVLAAYDPAIFAHELGVIVQNIAGGLRALDPAALLGDLTLFDDLADRIEAVVPTEALAGVGESLAAVGLQLREIDPQALLDALERLAPELVEIFAVAVETIRQEIVALLESLRYAAANATATVEVG
jgi:hypothetical protein